MSSHLGQDQAILAVWSSSLELNGVLSLTSQGTGERSGSQPETGSPCGSVEAELVAPVTLRLQSRERYGESRPGLSESLPGLGIPGSEPSAPSGPSLPRPCICCWPGAPVLSGPAGCVPAL